MDLSRSLGSLQRVGSKCCSYLSLSTRAPELNRSLQPGARPTLLVYRDRLVPRSEAQFLRQLYVGFEHLAPVWVGCRIDEGLKDLGIKPLILGRKGLLGTLDRALFKQFGVLPPYPDLRELRPRIIHAHFGRGGALALPIARKLRIPLVVTFHGGDATKDKHYDHRLVPTIFQRRLAALQREAAAFVCVSESIRQRLIERGFPVHKLQVIRYGVEMTSSRVESAPGDTFVLFVGRFVEKKGINHLIEAMRILKARGLGIRLVLIGDGPMASDLKKQADGLERKEFLGWLPNHEVHRWMRGATAVCVPSVTAQAGDEEGLPNVLLEAMAEGVPVIGSKNAGIGEVIEDGRTGLLVPPGDPPAIASAIESLANSPNFRRLIGQAAQATIAERFSAVAQSQLLEDMLLSTMTKKN